MRALPAGEAGHFPGVSEVRIGERRFFGIEGRPLPLYVREGCNVQPAATTVAADPETGTVLVGMSWLIHRAQWRGPFAPSLSSYFPADVTSLGGDDFASVVLRQASGGYPVEYRLFSANRWSAAVEVGRTEVDSFWGFPFDTVGMAGTAKGAGLRRLGGEGRDRRALGGAGRVMMRDSR